LIETEETPIFQHIARDITEERRLQENLRLYASQISKAYEEERKRVARELHDDTIQSMVAVSRHLDNLTSKDGRVPKKLLKPLEELRRDIDESLIRTRRLTQDLRPPTLEYLGLIPALRELVTQLRE
jgi:signal transduction histidine kinase